MALYHSYTDDITFGIYLLQVIFDVCSDPKFLKTVIKYLPENFKLSKELVGASGDSINRIKHVATIEN